MGVGAVGLGVGPLVEKGLDEPLSFAVGARAIGSGHPVLDAELSKRLRKAAGLSINRVLVSHHSFNSDSLSDIEADQLTNEIRAGAVAFVGVDIDESNSGGVIHGNVHEVVTTPSLAAPADQAADHAVATSGWYSAQFLDVDVDELTWALTHIPNRSSSDPVEVSESGNSMSAQDRVDGRGSSANQRPKPIRALPHAHAQLQDSLLLLRRDLAWGPERTR